MAPRKKGDDADGSEELDLSDDDADGDEELDGEEQPKVRFTFKKWQSYDGLVNGYNWASGLYTAEYYRIAPKAFQNTGAVGIVGSYPKPLTETELMERHGGTRYICRVRGPVDPTDPEAHVRWVGSYPNLVCPGEPKIPGVNKPDELDHDDVRAIKKRDEMLSKEDNLLLRSTIDRSDRLERRIEKLYEERNRDPASDTLRDVLLAQERAAERLATQQQEGVRTMAEMIAKFADAIGSGKGRDDLQHYMSMVTGARETIERQMGEHTKQMDTIRRETWEQVQAAEKRAMEDRVRMREDHEKDRRDLIERHAVTEKALRDGFDRELRGKEDAIRELREEVRRHLDKIDRLTGDLSEARIKAAQGNGSSNVGQLENTLGFLSAAKDLFGGGGAEKGDWTDKVFALVESGVVERAVGNVGSRVAAALKTGQANPAAAAESRQAWQAYQQQVAANQQQLQTATRTTRLPAAQRRTQQAAAAQQQQQQQPEEPPAPEAPAAQFDLAQLPIALQQAIDQSVPPETFYAGVKQAIEASPYGADGLQQLAAIDDQTVIGAIESQGGGRLPILSRDYLRKVLALARQEVSRGSGTAS